MKLIFDIILTSRFTTEKGEEKMGNEKNVLLISMSTMSNQDKNYYYILHSDNDPDFYTGISSMAAGTKHVLHRLARGGRKLDKIIVLTTPEVEKDGALNNYKEEIKTYIKNGDVISDIKTAVCSDEEVRKDIVSIAPEKTEGACCTVEEFEQMICQIDIPSPNEDLSYSAIPKIVSEVSSLRVNDSKVNLFLDMQGGSRVSTFIVNSAVNMMRDGDNVRLERSYATLYNRKEQVHQLRDESMSNHVFDLVSGMDEFLNYGKAKKFLEYYNYYRENHYNVNVGDGNYPEKEVIESIKRISDAINISDVKGFYIGLNKLGDALDNYNDSSVTNKDDLFVGFVSRIEESYEGILDKNNRRDIDVMDWCIKKELYQQALTICESKMPRLFVKDKVIYYCKSIQEKQNNRCPEFGADYDKKRDSRDVNLFVLKSYGYIKGKSRAEMLEILLDNDVNNIQGKKLYSDYWVANRAQVMQILNLYEKLCKQRNKVNHGNANSQQIESFVGEMNLFVREYRNLVGDNGPDSSKQLDDSLIINYSEVEPYINN